MCSSQNASHRDRIGNTLFSLIHVRPNAAGSQPESEVKTISANKCCDDHPDFKNASHNQHTKESIIEKTYSSKNSVNPMLFT